MKRNAGVVARGVLRSALVGALAAWPGLAGARAQSAAPAADLAAPKAALEARERAFAATMARRDHAAFTAMLSEEAVFFNGPTEIRGKAAVAAAWKPFFEGPSAPFSWEPDSVAVLDSGRLGLSAGPVYAPDGKRTGTFNSVWRLEADGVWRIVFDRGCPPCPKCP